MEKDPKKQWYAMLRLMIDEYRQGNPDDQRDDGQIAKDLMEYFSKHGLAKKRGGKYVLPKLIHDA